MIITPDLSEVSTKQYEPLAAGTYSVRIDSSVVKPTKAGDKTYITWKLVVFGDANPKNNNQHIYYNTMTSGPGASMLLYFYRAATGESLAGPFDMTDLYGKEVYATITQGVNPDGTPTKWPNVKEIKPIF